MQHLDCEMLPETFCYNNPWTKCCMRKCWRNCPSTQYYKRRCREIMQIFGNIMACSLIGTTVFFSHKTALTCSKQNHIKWYLPWAQLKKNLTKKIGNHHLLGYPIIHGWPSTQPGSLHTALQRKYTQPCSLFSRGTAVWTIGARLCEQWGTAVCKCPAV